MKSQEAAGRRTNSIGGAAVTKECLEDYKSNKEEIEELKYKLQHLCEGDAMIGNDTIFDYRSGYPVPQAVVGVDWDKIDRSELRYKNRIKQLEKECDEVEEFIENIPNGITRRIFRMYYLDGMSQEDISVKTNMERSSISKKITNYLKLSHKSHNSHL